MRIRSTQAQNICFSIEIASIWRTIRIFIWECPIYSKSYKYPWHSILLNEMNFSLIGLNLDLNEMSLVVFIIQYIKAEECIHFNKPLGNSAEIMLNPNNTNSDLYSAGIFHFQNWHWEFPQVTHHLLYRKSQKLTWLDRDYFKQSMSMAFCKKILEFVEKLLYSEFFFVNCTTFFSLNLALFKIELHLF